MKNEKRIVIVGATSAIAEQCARLWAKESPAEIVLVGRNLDKVEQVALDLRVRSPNTKVTSTTTNFLDPQRIQDDVERICDGGAVDIVLIAHGSLPSQELCQNDLKECFSALNINGVSPVLFAEAFAMQMQRSGKGTLAIVSSVAGDRARKSNYVYGAAKGLVSSYTEGLQHRFAATNIRVVLIKPGPTDTPMTAQLKQLGRKLADVNTVARQIVDGIEKRNWIIYSPVKWALIMMVIRKIPRFIFHKMDI